MRINYISDYNLSQFFNVPALLEKISETSFKKELLEAAIFFCINKKRVKFDRSVLKFHPMLKELAQLHTDQMKKHNFFDHENPYNARFKTLKNRIKYIKQNYEEIKELHEYVQNIADLPTFDTEGARILNNIIFYKDGDLSSVFGPPPKEKVFTYLDFAKLYVRLLMNYPYHGKFVLNREFKFLGCSTVIYKRRSHNHQVNLPSIKITSICRKDLQN